MTPLLSFDCLDPNRELDSEAETAESGSLGGRGGGGGGGGGSNTGRLGCDGACECGGATPQP